MATRKPNPIVKHLEVVIAVAGLAIFLIVGVVSASKVLSMPSASAQDVDSNTKAYVDWYTKWRQAEVNVAPAENLLKDLNSLIADYQKPEGTSSWLHHPAPYVRIPRKPEDANYIGKAVLSAAPEYDKVTVIVRFEDIDKMYETVSPTTKQKESYPHLLADDLVVMISRGEIGADGKTVVWEQNPYPAKLSPERGAFTWLDEGRIKGVVQIYYKATVQSKKWFLDARQLKVGQPIPTPTENAPPAIAAVTAGGKEELAVTTLSPWAVEVSQQWNGTTVDVTLTDKSKPSEPPKVFSLKAGDKIGDTTYRLMNIIHPSYFLITIQGDITQITLRMGVLNPITNGQLVEVPEIVWDQDPFAPVDGNDAIIAAFTKLAFEALKKTSGKLDLGGADFDYENNFITNILKRAVATAQPVAIGKLTDSLGRQIQQLQYQGPAAGGPVKLIPYVWAAEDVGKDQSLVLHIYPGIRENKVTYWAEYSKVDDKKKISTIFTGPYEFTLKDFDMASRGKMDRVIKAMTDEVRNTLKGGAFGKAPSKELKDLGMTPVGPVSLYRRMPVDGISTTSDDLGLKQKDVLGSSLNAVIQYFDMNIKAGAKLIEVPVIPIGKRVPVAPAGPPAAAPEEAFKKALSGKLAFPDKKAPVTNLDTAVKYLKTTGGMKNVTVDDSVKALEGWNTIKFEVPVEQGTITVDELVNKIVEAFNKAIAGNEKAGNKKLVREDNAPNEEIRLKLQ
jgi:predicted transcriptional regulator